MHVYTSRIEGKSYDDLINELKTFGAVDVPELGLQDYQDQIVILQNMKEDGIPIEGCGYHLRALFHHVDNIRYVYRMYKLEPEIDVPDWYREKYGHLFAV